MTQESPERPPLRDRCRELVEEWKEASEHDAENGYENAAGTWAIAAKGLEAVLEDYDR